MTTIDQKEQFPQRHTELEAPNQFGLTPGDLDGYFTQTMAGLHQVQEFILPVKLYLSYHNQYWPEITPTDVSVVEAIDNLFGAKIVKHTKKIADPLLHSVILDNVRSYSLIDNPDVTIQPLTNPFPISEQIGFQIVSLTKFDHIIPVCLAFPLQDTITDPFLIRANREMLNKMSDIISVMNEPFTLRLTEQTPQKKTPPIRGKQATLLTLVRHIRSNSVPDASDLIWLDGNANPIERDSRMGSLSDRSTHVFDHFQFFGIIDKTYLRFNGTFAPYLPEINFSGNKTRFWQIDLSQGDITRSIPLPITLTETNRWRPSFQVVTVGTMLYEMMELLKTRTAKVMNEVFQPSTDWLYFMQRYAITNHAFDKQLVSVLQYAPACNLFSIVSMLKHEEEAVKRVLGE